MLQEPGFTPSNFSSQRGYSLLELAASLILVAAIAVLSLPTYKDFAPHEAAELVHTPAVSDGQASAVAPPANKEIQDQPELHPVEKEGKELVATAEETKDD